VPQREVFTTLAEARRIVEAWRIDYNTISRMVG
jgi:hypothetical protein